MATDTIRKLPQYAAFGFDFQRRTAVAQHQTGDTGFDMFLTPPIGTTNLVFNNFLKVLGYLPGIGVLVGAARIYKGYGDYKANKENAGWHILRGVMELFFSFVLLFIDLAMTYRDDNTVEEYWKKVPARVVGALSTI